MSTIIAKPEPGIHDGHQKPHTSEKSDLLLKLLGNIEEMDSQGVSIGEIEGAEDQECNMRYLILRKHVRQWCNNTATTSHQATPKTPALTKAPSSMASGSARHDDDETDHTHELSDFHSEHATMGNGSDSTMDDNQSELDEEFHDVGVARRLDRKRSDVSNSSFSNEELELLGRFELILTQQQQDEQLHKERELREQLEHQLQDKDVELQAERDYCAKLQDQLLVQQNQLEKQQTMLAVFRDRVTEHSRIQRRLEKEIDCLRSVEVEPVEPPCRDSFVSVRKSVLNMLLGRHKSKENAIAVLDRFNSDGSFKLDELEHCFV